jgi:hypothetical protein
MVRKRIVTALLALVLVLAVCAPAVLAVDNSKHYDFTIAVDGKETVAVGVGDVVTVTVTLKAEGDSFPLYALRDRIIFSNEYFELVPNSLVAGKGVAVSTEKMTGTWADWTGVNSDALAAKIEGDTWESPITIATFRLKTLKTGTSAILHRESKMSTTNGMDEYDSTAANATVIIRNFPYTDVASAEWYRAAVEYAFDNNLIDGKTGTTFAPESPMTRAMLVTALYRKERSPSGAKAATFTDVPSSGELARAVAWAVEAKITNGIGDNKFDPDGNITREQIAAMFFRYATFKKADTSAKGDLSVFSDASRISDWAKDALIWANGAKIINGNTDGTVAPQGTATRAQVSQILLNYSK